MSALFSNGQCRPVRWVQVLRAQGRPVLSLTLSLPRLTGGGTGAERVNRHFTRLREAWRRRWTGPLYRAAAQAPPPPWSASLDYRVTLHTQDQFSLLWTASVTRGETVKTVSCGECWDLRTGALLTLKEVLHLRRRDLTARLSQALEARPGLFPDWKARLRAALDPDRFYLTEEGPVLFFPPGRLADHFLQVPLPWDTEPVQ